MEAEGLVERHASTEDRRVVMVTATATGRRTVQEGRRRRVAVVAERLRRLDATDVELLDRAATLMERIAQG
jgi:DNA-binding MarR family transcriptional regulator